jgi:hypothetical protein
VEIRVVRAHVGAFSASLIGRFLLAGIRTANRGEPRIEIGLDLDRCGLLHAWAEEKATGAREDACFSLSSARATETSPLLSEIRARASRLRASADIWSEIEEIRCLQEGSGPCVKVAAAQGGASVAVPRGFGGVAAPRTAASCALRAQDATMALQTLAGELFRAPLSADGKRRFQVARNGL